MTSPEVAKNNDLADYLVDILSKSVIESAASMKVNVVFPGMNELFLDIDSVKAYQLFNDKLYLLDYWGVENVDKQPSKREGHFHIRVRLRKILTNYERIALQACLGSDLTRELLSCVREVNGDPHPTLFLEKLEEEVRRTEP